MMLHDLWGQGYSTRTELREETHSSDWQWGVTIAEEYESEYELTLKIEMHKCMKEPAWCPPDEDEYSVQCVLINRQNWFTCNIRFDWVESVMAWIILVYQFIGLYECDSIYLMTHRY